MIQNITDGDLIQEWLEYMLQRNLPHVTILLIFLITGIVGNTTVIYVYAFKMRRCREDRFFIPALAVTDLLATIVTCLYHSIKTLAVKKVNSDILCKVPLFLMWSTSTASAMLLLMIAIHRSIKVRQQPGNILSSKLKKGAIILTIVVSIAINAPILYFAGVREFTTSYKGANITVTGCFTGNSGHKSLEQAYVIFVFLVAVGNIIATTGLYIPIGCVIYKISRQNKNVDRPRSRSRAFSFISEAQSSISDTSDREKKYPTPSELDNVKLNRQEYRTRNRTNFNKMFAILVLFYAVSYFPSFIFVFLSRGDPNFYNRLPSFLSNLFLTLQRLFIVNHIVNPLVYGYFDLKFRQKLANMCCFKKPRAY
ncbi:QRFP-like peptide receptor [Ostrea edulis]|uniref:QRFP-like peptide receptor n=1 Tax=Ostrea edulis TaxID=37623 RepID=UPI0020945FB7|nr:QRFP-like peptide receptor [Ostrea edulis]XP_056007814.1 QRFP-like peptide receptor [Ostrea edulis]XP_056007815.1 QRFP-like peptide receptor [Ostrea edulis]XP_056007816.1 QRFP-like peptide receptor [Ostrea edulis]